MAMTANRVSIRTAIAAATQTLERLIFRSAPETMASVSVDLTPAILETFGVMLDHKMRRFHELFDIGRSHYKHTTETTNTLCNVTARHSHSFQSLLSKYSDSAKVHKSKIHFIGGRLQS